MKPLPIDERVAEFLEIREYPGYKNPFCRRQAPGAFDNGTAIVKTGTVPGEDANPDGTPGIVLGSISYHNMGMLYFVAWNHSPRVAIAIAAERIKKDTRAR